MIVSFPSILDGVRMARVSLFPVLALSDRKVSSVMLDVAKGERADFPAGPFVMCASIRATAFNKQFNK